MTGCTACAARMWLTFGARLGGTVIDYAESCAHGRPGLSDPEPDCDIHGSGAF